MVNYVSTRSLRDDERAMIFNKLDEATEGNPNAKVWDWFDFSDKLRITEEGMKYLAGLKEKA